MSLTDFLVDISTISFLLFLAFIIRRKVFFMQKYFLPASLIAGIIGLLLGPQVLGLVSPVCIRFSDSISQWTGFFFAFIFTTSFLGTSAMKLGRPALSSICQIGVIHMMQICVGLLIAFGLSRFMDVPYAIGSLPVSGFYGGHGSAGVVGEGFKALGWDDAMGIAMTYATVGMFMAVLGGMVITNMGAKRGVTNRRMDSNFLTVSQKTGIVPEEERKSIGTAIVDNAVMDPMAFQFMIVGVIIAISYVLRNAIIKVIPFWSKIPLYAMCLFMGAILGNIISKTKYNQYIDRNSMKRISGVAVEYAVTSAIVTIKISVLATYLVPIVVTSLVLTVLTAAVSIFLLKRWYGEGWFETAVGCFGLTTGSMATGLLLCRVLDPDNETLAAESVTAASTMGNFLQQPYNTLGPILLMSNPVTYTWISVGLLAAFLVVGEVLFGRRK